jgi:pimeloyl-ACP methyl ester carboxylesterase
MYAIFEWPAPGEKFQYYGSSDYEHWQPVQFTDNPGERLTLIGFGLGKWWAFDDSNHVVTSSDGIHFHLEDVNLYYPSYPWDYETYSLVELEGLLYYVTYEGNFTSIDGVHWTQVADLPAGLNTERGVNLFVAGGAIRVQDGLGQWSTTDGLNWVDDCTAEPFLCNFWTRPYSQPHYSFYLIYASVYIPEDEPPHYEYMQGSVWGVSDGLYLPERHVVIPTFYPLPDCGEATWYESLPSFDLVGSNCGVFSFETSSSLSVSYDRGATFSRLSYCTGALCGITPFAVNGTEFIGVAQDYSDPFYRAQLFRFTGTTSLAAFRADTASVDSTTYRPIEGSIWIGSPLRLVFSLVNTKSQPEGCDLRVVNGDQDAVLERSLDVQPQTSTIHFDLSAEDLWHADSVSSEQIDLSATLTCGDEEMSLSQSFLLKSPPIIFVHGWRSGASTWTSMYSFFEDRDYDVSAIELVTGGILSSTPYETIRANAEVLAAEIVRRRVATDSWQLDLVAHSMGGLISRRALFSSILGGRKPVRKLVEMGVPHLGSPFAYLNPMNPSMYELLPAVATENAIGTTALFPTTAFALAGNYFEHSIVFPDEFNDGIVGMESALFDVSQTMVTPVTHINMTDNLTLAETFIRPSLGQPGEDDLFTRSVPSGVQQSAPKYLLVGSDCLDGGESASYQIATNVGTTIVGYVISDAAEISATLITPSETTALDVSDDGLILEHLITEAGVHVLRVQNSGSALSCFDTSVTSPYEPTLIAVAFGTRDSRSVVRVDVAASGATGVPQVTVIATNGERRDVIVNDVGALGDAFAGDGVFSAYVPDELQPRLGVCTAIAKVSDGSAAMLYATGAGWCDESILAAGFESPSGT